eukprot:4775254-Heterocapsa_arctica.AAC.1
MSQGDGPGAKAAKTTAKPKSVGRRTRGTEGAAEVQVAKTKQSPGHEHRRVSAALRPRATGTCNRHGIA